MASLGNLFAQAQSSVLSGTNLILVSPQRNIGALPSYKNIATEQGFLFDVYGEDTAGLQSDITDHFIENNSSIQDHIALKPEIITVSGFISELNNIAPDLGTVTAAIAARLPALAPFRPELTVAALRAYNTALQAIQTAKTVINEFDKFLTTGQNAQQKAFDHFYSQWLSRTLFYVQTPWLIFDNMAIQSLNAVQDDTSNTITNFEITFKKVRFAAPLISSNAQTTMGRNATAKETVYAGAQTNGVKVPLEKAVV